MSFFSVDKKTRAGKRVDDIWDFKLSGVEKHASVLGGRFVDLTRKRLYQKNVLLLEIR